MKLVWKAPEGGADAYEISVNGAVIATTSATFLELEPHLWREDFTLVSLRGGLRSEPIDCFVMNIYPDTFGHPLVEFPTRIGQRYLVQRSLDGQNWNTITDLTAFTTLTTIGGGQETFATFRVLKG